MDGDGEDSVDFSSDGDVVGDATMRVLNVLGRPKRRATARKCDEGLRRGGKRQVPHGSLVSLDSRSTR